MRKKIAKRRRRECLRRGLVVEYIHRFPKDRYCSICAAYKSRDGKSNILALAEDELEAWQMVLEAMNFTDEMEEEHP